MLKAALPWVLAAALAFGLSAVAGTSYTAPPEHELEAPVTPENTEDI